MSAVAFLFTFLGRPMSRKIPRGSRSRDLSARRLAREDCPSTLMERLLPSLSLEESAKRASFKAGLIWFLMIRESVKLVMF